MIEELEAQGNPDLASRAAKAVQHLLFTADGNFSANVTQAWAGPVCRAAPTAEYYQRQSFTCIWTPILGRPFDLNPAFSWEAWRDPLACL